MNKLFVLIGGSFLILALIVVLVLFNLPVKGATDTPTNDPSLPDLAITSVYVSMVDTDGRCLPYYGFFVTVANLRDAPAPDVMLVETNTEQEVLLGTINGHQSINTPFVAKAVSGAYGVVADPQNLIAESNENNNSAIYSETTATPPASCLPGLFSDSTPIRVIPEATFTAVTQNILPTLPALVLPTVVTAGNPTLSLDVLRNGLYHSQDWGKYQLTNGVYYRTPSTSQESPEAYTSRILDQVIFGDINLDGFEDAVVFMATQNGGSGHFVEMAVVLNLNGSPSNISTLYLGDRVMVEGGAVMNGLIALNLRVQGPNDAACCPSQAAALTYLIQVATYHRKLRLQASTSRATLISKPLAVTA